MFENVTKMEPVDIFEEIEARRSSGVTDYFDEMRLKSLESELERRGMVMKPNKLQPVRTDRRIRTVQTIVIHRRVAIA